jgi:hypothetical protein
VLEHKSMSIRAMSAARDITDITPKEKFVLMALADYANDLGIAWPRIGTLETWTCMSRSSIIRALNALEERGIIEKASRAHDSGAQRSNQYRLRCVPVEAFGNAEDFGLDTGGVSTTDGGGVRLTPLELPIERSEELRPSSSSRKEHAQTLVDIWNANCGTLPSVKAISPARQSKLASLVVAAGGIDAAMAMLEKATKVVAADDFWIKGKYGLDNLLSGGKVFARAEQYEAQHEHTHPEVKVGDKVRMWFMAGAQRITGRGEVTSVTDSQVVLVTPLGVEVRVPKRDVIEVIS